MFAKMLAHSPVRELDGSDAHGVGQGVCPRDDPGRGRGGAAARVAAHHAVRPAADDAVPCHGHAQRGARGGCLSLDSLQWGGQGLQWVGVCFYLTPSFLARAAACPCAAEFSKQMKPLLLTCC